MSSNSSGKSTPQTFAMLGKFCLLLLVCLSASQSSSFRGFSRGFVRSRPRSSPGAVDARRGGSEYHYSWRHDGGRKYSGRGAQVYCSRLGPRWQPVSVETQQESHWLNGVVSSERQQYIWTSGFRSRSAWRWASGSVVAPLNWSPTGGFRRPQPDNREGHENCLAVLNNFYRDGIRWHDVGCNHRKPVVCERKA